MANRFALAAWGRRLSRPLLVGPILAGVQLAAPLTVGAAPPAVTDPRPKSSVVDTTGTLGPAEVGQIDSLAARARSAGELVVVVIPSVGGAVPRQFTTELFNRWRLDTRERNRGVILLAALNDRKAEIVIGDGFTKSATQVTDRIMRDVLVPNFKAGRPRVALVEGARAIVDKLILGQVQPGTTRTPAGATPRQADTALPPAEAAPRALAPLPRQPPPPPAPRGFVDQAAAAASEHPLPVAGGVGGAIAGAVAFVRRQLRRRPRNCPRCSTSMERLDEAADDAHLTEAEKAEERVKSVDYDVWACPSCSETQKLRYGTFFTSYARCPRCTAKTLRSVRTTVHAATTSSTGLARITETCAHCSHSHTYTKTIPRVSQSRSSSSRSGGSSSGRGSSGSW